MAVQIPLVIHIERLRLEIRTGTQLEDRIPHDDVAVRRDDWMEHIAGIHQRCLDAERVDAEVRSRLVVVRDALLGPILIAADDADAGFRIALTEHTLDPWKGAELFHQGCLGARREDIDVAARLAAATQAADRRELRSRRVFAQKRDELRGNRSGIG